MLALPDDGGCPMDLGAPELLVILLIALLLFGARRLPDLAKGLGGAISEFRKAANEDETDSAEKTED